MADEENMATSPKICELCCVPNCISNRAAKNETIEVVFVFRPPIEDIDKWSLSLGIPITESSFVCELHFKAPDFILGKMDGLIDKSLVRGAIPVLIPHVDGLNHLKGPKKQLKFDDLPKNVGHSSSKLNEVSTTTLPETMINSSSQYISQSTPIHDDQTPIVTRTEIDTNSILKPLSETRSVPVPIPIPSADESGSRTERMFSHISMPVPNISQSKNRKHNEHTSVINITEVDTNSILRRSSERTVKPIPATTSAYESSARIQKMFSNNSMSIIIDSDDKQNKKSLPVNSTEIINTSILKQTLINEPTSVLSKASIDSSTPNTSQSNLIKILPKTFTNGSVSITLKSNINPSEIDSADILKPTSLTDNVMSNSVESTFKDPILKNLVNNKTLSITREPSYKQKNPMSTINSTDVFKSPSVSVQVLKRKPGPTDIPSSSTNDSLINVNISNELPSGDELANPLDPFDISQKEIKLEPMDDYDYPISTENVIMMNSESPINMTGNINVEKTTLIRDISKTVVLPNVFWRSLYHREQNNTVFIERNELMESVKKVFFKNSLVPMIYINNKRYEYNETIDNKIALENLLSKIDKIEICSGYDGFVHDQCIGYLENTSALNRSEVCNRCHSLVEKEFFSKYETEITEKMNIIKEIEKTIMERERRISDAFKRLQSKIKDPKNIYKHSKCNDV